MANFFPRWTNFLPLKIAICAGSIGVGVVLGFNTYATPEAVRKGYKPSQPIPFSHDIHAGQLGLDCRYCHSFVDVAGHSNVPSANTCYNCHQHIQRDNPRLEPLHRAMDKTYPGYDGKPIEWVRVHRLPDFVYFDHSAHVNRGISCVSCHGRVDQMEVVFHAKSLSMGWCLDCHRAPEAHLRPLEQVYQLDYDAEKYLADPKNAVTGADGKRVTTQEGFGALLKKEWQIKPRETCATCHH
jgi:hypothetical protein